MGAGEGSRGGKVVGHSKSGRPIYAAEATAKAAMGMDPHPGVRQATPHAPFSGDRSGTVPGAGGLSTKDSPAHLRDPGHAGALPKYSETHGWQGGAKNTLFAVTDKRTGSTTVRPAEQMSGVGPEVHVRQATRAEAEQHWQSPLHSGWKVDEGAGGSGGGAKGADFNSLRNKGHDVSERAFRTGSAEDHKAALQMQTKLAGMAKGSPEFQKYHLERAAQHKDALKRMGA